MEIKGYSLKGNAKINFRPWQWGIHILDRIASRLDYVRRSVMLKRIENSEVENGEFTTLNFHVSTHARSNVTCGHTMSFSGVIQTGGHSVWNSFENVNFGFYSI